MAFLLHLREVAPDTFFFDPAKVVHACVGEALMFLFQVLMFAVSTMTAHGAVVMISVAKLTVLMHVLGQVIETIRTRLFVQAGWAITYFGIFTAVNTNTTFRLERKLLDLIEKPHPRLPNLWIQNQFIVVIRQNFNEQCLLNIEAELTQLKPY
ncbi:hypothetical protein [Pseudomonas sp.]|uniref:hypothetical protein n=1 Tax=Pseudomonas sp. TaxID=306 RepID=UPI001B017675|nr:hypothetical protein [Pseudomonas sp.]MBO9551078.1 hypothetical protein [Pseudomonas sp.]